MFLFHLRERLEGFFATKPLSVWRHVVFVFDGTRFNVYIDGVKQELVRSKLLNVFGIFCSLNSVMLH